MQDLTIVTASSEDMLYIWENTVTLATNEKEKHEFNILIKQLNNKNVFVSLSNTHKNTPVIYIIISKEIFPQGITQW